MFSPTTWVVIADGARARIAQSRGAKEPLRSAMDYDFAAPHAPTRALVSDRPGRYTELGPGRRHAVQPRTDRHEFEKTLFARHLARVLEQGARRGRFDRLVLVAPPATLGLLRAALGRHARSMLTVEIGKDLTHCPLHGLQRRIHPFLHRRARADAVTPLA